MTSWPNSDVQVARFHNLTEFNLTNWRGIPIEMGGRGGLVQLWGVNHFCPYETNFDGMHLFLSCLSSNPEHAGDLPLGLDDLIGSPAIYGTMIQAHRVVNVTESFVIHLFNQYTPLYGIVRPRRQVWVLYLTDWGGDDRFGIEIYYTDISASAEHEDAVNRKYGKYRRS